LLDVARHEAESIFKEDPSLTEPKYRLLVQQVENFWNRESDLS